MAIPLESNVCNSAGSRRRVHSPMMKCVLVFCDHILALEEHSLEEKGTPVQ